MPEKRFLLFPTEYMPSAHDVQVHRITFTMLVRLYGLNPQECVNADDPEQTLGRDLKPLIWLKPRYSGDYKEHLQKKLRERSKEDA